jgi:TIR domain
VLEEASYSVWFQDWDFRGNFVEHMNRAHAQADRTLAVLSDHYFGSDFTLAEWSARFAQDPAAREDRLVAVKVGSLTGENILGPVIYADLTDCDEDYARQRLLGRVKSEACDWQGTVRMHVIWWNACGHCLDWPIRQCRTVRRNTHQSDERRRVRTAQESSRLVYAGWRPRSDLETRIEQAVGATPSCKIDARALARLWRDQGKVQQRANCWLRFEGGEGVARRVGAIC